MGCCFWLSTVTNTCLNVWLCHWDTRQMAMCDIQGENTWRELVRCVEVLHILSVLLIDGELPVMNQSLMSQDTSYLSKTVVKGTESKCAVQHLVSVAPCALSSSYRTLTKNLLLMLFCQLSKKSKPTNAFFKVIDSQKLMQVWDLKEQKVFIMFLKQMSNINSFMSA